MCNKSDTLKQYTWSLLICRDMAYKRDGIIGAFDPKMHWRPVLTQMNGNRCNHPVFRWKTLVPPPKALRMTFGFCSSQFNTNKLKAFDLMSALQEHVRIFGNAQLEKRGDYASYYGCLE